MQVYHDETLSRRYKKSKRLIDILKFIVSEYNSKGKVTLKDVFRFNITKWGLSNSSILSYIKELENAGCIKVDLLDDTITLLDGAYEFLKDYSIINISRVEGMIIKRMNNKSIDIDDKIINNIDESIKTIDIIDEFFKNLFDMTEDIKAYEEISKKIKNIKDTLSSIKEIIISMKSR